MTKKVLFFIPFITLIALTGCQNNTNKNKKGDVVSAAVLKANTKEVRKDIYSNFEMSIASFPIQGDYHFENGFLVVEDSTNIKLYSVIVNRVLATISATDTYHTYSSTVAGGYVSYVTSNGVTVLDALGNELVKDSKRTYSSLDVLSGLTENNIYYCDVKFDDTSLYYHYDDKGVATVHSTYMGDDFGSGTSVQGIDYVLLDDFGHPGYIRIKNSSRYIVFDKKGNEISSFTDPNADAEFFVGDYLIYQNSVKLDDNNNNYDFISATGERYSLETYRINYLNAKKEAIKVDYLLSTGLDDIHSFRNSKGIYTYAYANLRTISDKKILSSTLETFILDSAGTRHDNVTGINLGAFERLGKNYYNTDSKTIYDGNLNEISILTNMNPQKVDNAEMIVCSIDGRYGAINQQGKVVLPFEYDFIYTTYMSNNKALVIDDGVTKVVNFDSEKPRHNDVATFENGTFTYFGCGIYKLDTEYFKLYDGQYVDLDDSTSTFTYAISHATSAAKLVVIDSNGFHTGNITINH